MGQVSICRLNTVREIDDLRGKIDRIFFESSAVTSFADEAARQAFNERWLGRYVTHYPDWFYVALCDGRRDVAGYLAGCVQDVRDTSLFDDISYFDDFSKHLDRYPAHLHVNLASQLRSQGIGAQLVARFLTDAANGGACGVHVVTGQGSRNVGFYNRCGFKVIDSAPFGASTSVFLGICV